MHYTIEELQSLVDEITNEGNWSIADHFLYALKCNNCKLDDNCRVVKCC